MGRQMAKGMMGRKVAQGMMGRQMVSGRRRRRLLGEGDTGKARGQRGHDDKGLDHLR